MARMSAAEHRKYATIPPSPKYPNGRFPVKPGEPGNIHARLALQMLGRAKGMSGAQVAKVRTRATAAKGALKK